MFNNYYGYIAVLKQYCRQLPSVRISTVYDMNFAAVQSCWDLNLCDDLFTPRFNHYAIIFISTHSLNNLFVIS